MNEEKNIKRIWPKKAAFIFFVIMLILTFFSNTIMNMSLPQVSVYSVKEGEIGTVIRGSGIAEAIGNYEVMISQSRKVQEVLVQAGDTVNEGDVLFLLDDEESEELEMALDKLDDLKIQHQKMLINWPSPDYTQEDRNIERTKQELEEAMIKRDANNVSKYQVDNMEHLINMKEEELEDLTDEVNELQTELSDYSGATDEMLKSLKRQIEDKENQIDNARPSRERNPVSLSSLKLNLQRLKEDYEILVAKYPDYDSVNNDLDNSKVALDKKKKELSDAEKNNASEDVIKTLKENIQSLENKVNELKTKLLGYSELTSLVRRIEDKEDEIKDHEPYVEGPAIDTDQWELELERLEEDYKDMRDKNRDYNRVKEKLKDTKDDLSEVEESLELLRENHNSLSEKYDKWKAADEEAFRLQNELEDLLLSVENNKKSDKRAASIAELDSKKLKEDIEKQRELVNELRTDVTNGKVVADKDGIIKSINIAAGRMTSPNAAMAVIETIDQGYSLSFSVTKEQSKMLSIGDIANVEDSNITATLKQIKNDPSNPDENKVLTFLLEGEIESGDVFSLSIEQPSADYDFVIPRSALHSDSRGDFVFTVRSKKTPFGSRYIAKRVNVKILDENDQNVAVSGALMRGDYVITTSTELIESGIQVRMMNK
ncbi:biotin/lipoyl-binding protein [Maledivibacter halophilus]|uniref:Biotin-lipoyl like n=1 Tax=Maledivibacter halophilus TaxID=36842 RepID=A0A1T5LMN9_9FIRM|nr:biotin/lipoyl-binding protein [Maledivibacter halophilus]SKC76799.1 Biotin-lipoyl like [Maledivibacter halophilus]